MKKRIWLLICGAVSIHAMAQREVLTRASIENRQRVLRQMPVQPEKERAIQFARQNMIPVRQVDPSGRIREIMNIDNNGMPRYNKTLNADAAITISTTKVWRGAFPGAEIRGQGILVGLWDGGLIRTSHVEFGSRAYSMDSGLGIDGHPTHVAGTIGAAGVNPAAIGMASMCAIEGYEWNNDSTEMRLAAQDGLLISNHSYGFVQGWDYNDRWEWNGNIAIDDKEDYMFGFYGTGARRWDDIAYDNPYYLIVKSAGNDRLDGPRAGTEHYYWDNGWKVSTDVRDLDGGPDGYDCLGTRSTAKNILTVGAVRDLEKGFQNPGEVFLTDFSAFGPTDDGRIKPDLVGNGAALYSAWDGNNTDYQNSTGTSMAAGNISGSLALLQELFFREYQVYMKSSMLKGLVLHTADDAGRTGPDYMFGWGLMNTYHAARHITDEKKVLMDDSIRNNNRNDYRFYAPGDSSARITLCWTDPMGPILAPALDPEILILVNDLDMRLISLEDSTIYEPYILNPSAPAEPAQTGDNFRDNIEQIHIGSLPRGYYDLVVSHKGSLKGSLQHYSLVADGVKKIFVAEDSTRLDGNNGFLQVTDAPDYPLNKRFVWLIEPRNGLPVNLHFTAFTTAEGDSVTIHDGPDATYPVLARFSGTLSDPDTMITSSTGSLFVEFTTGLQDGYPGFSSPYCTTPPEEGILVAGEPHPCLLTEEVYSIEALPETEYFWSFSDNIADPVQINPGRVSLQVPADPFTITVTPGNRCGTGDPGNRTLVPASGAPILEPLIAGDTAPCTNAPALFTVQDDPSTSYRWILPDGWSGESDSASILVTPLNQPGILRVVPWNSCGDADPIDLALDPVSPPLAPVIQSDRYSPCANSVQEFTFLPQDLVSYRWQVPAGWQINGPDSLPSVTVIVGDGLSGRMYLTSSNKCGDTLSSRNFLLAPSPDPPVLQTRASSIGGLEEAVIQNSTEYDVIRWYRDESPIPDFQGETLILQRNGTYSVEVANSEGCWAALSLDEQITVEDASLAYYVSTGTGGIIQVENDSGGEAVIGAYDLTGRKVFSGTLYPGTNRYLTTRRGLLILRIEGSTLQKSQMIFLH